MLGKEAKWSIIIVIYFQFVEDRLRNNCNLVDYQTSSGFATLLAKQKLKPGIASLNAEEALSQLLAS